MAHNLNVYNGQHVYMGKDPAWHQKGTVLGRFFSWREILEHGGFNFQVAKMQLINPITYEPIDSFGTFRTDNMDFLGNVGAAYEVIQHVESFELVDAIINSKDGAHYSTAGVLGKGERVWGLADLSLTVKVGDDKSQVYLFMLTSHDGSMSLIFKIVVTRVVCANTVRLALSEKTTNQFIIRHTKNAQNRIAAAHETLSAIESETMSVEEKLNMLNGKKMVKASFMTLMDKLFPNESEEKGPSDIKIKRMEEILARYELNDNNAFPEQRGTAYNALNAVTGWVDHDREVRGGDPERRKESAFFGSGDALKTKAYNVLLELAPTMPDKAGAPIYSMPSDTSMLDDIIDNTPVQ